jgi:hypothetical protein
MCCYKSKKSNMSYIKILTIFIAILKVVLDRKTQRQRVRETERQKDRMWLFALNTVEAA